MARELFTHTQNCDLSSCKSYIIILFYCSFRKTSQYIYFKQKQYCALDKTKNFQNSELVKEYNQVYIKYCSNQNYMEFLINIFPALNKIKTKETEIVFSFKLII